MSRVLQKLKLNPSRIWPQCGLQVQGAPSQPQQGMVVSWASFSLRGASFRQFVSACLSIVLLLPVLAPISVYAHADKSSACSCKSVCHCSYCKRHHQGVPPSDNEAAFDSPDHHCPCCPNQPPTQRSIRYVLTDTLAFRGEAVARPAGIKQTLARQRHTCIRVRQKRGPPTLFFTA